MVEVATVAIALSTPSLVPSFSWFLHSFLPHAAGGVAGGRQLEGGSQQGGSEGTPDNNKRRTMDDIRLCFLADAQTCLPSLPLSSSPSSFPSFPALLLPCRPHVPVTPNVTFHTLLAHCCIISSLTPWLLRPSLPAECLEISALMPSGPK